MRHKKSSKKGVVRTSFGIGGKYLDSEPPVEIGATLRSKGFALLEKIFYRKRNSILNFEHTGRRKDDNITYRSFQYCFYSNTIANPDMVNPT